MRLPVDIGNDARDSAGFRESGDCQVVGKFA